jgi:dedicator of cytokinesis protein 3
MVRTHALTLSRLLQDELSQSTPQDRQEPPNLHKMPWAPLPRIAFAVAIYPFQPASPADLPLELGDELYIIEQGGRNGEWYRGYLVAPPSLLAGLTSVKGQTLEARVFSGIFPRCCVEIREELGDVDLQKTPGGDEAPQQSETGQSEDSAVAEQQKNQNTRSPPPLKGLGLTNEKRQSLLQNRSYSSGNGLRVRSGVASWTSVQPAIRSPTTTTTTDTDHDTDIVKPQAPVPLLKIGDETPTSASEPLVDEIASCLREWQSTNLHELLLSRRYGTLEDMTIIVSQLDYARRQLLNDVLTAQERLALREQAIWNLVKGNKVLNGEVIVRDPTQRGRLLTGDDSAIALTKLQSVMSLLDNEPTVQNELRTLHHLLVELKSVTGSNPEAMTVDFSLWHKSMEGSFLPLSETFTVEVPSTESFANVARSNKLKTLFTDLSKQDVGETSENRLYLVVKVLASELPRTATAPAEPETLSRAGTLKDKAAHLGSNTIQDSLKRGRSSLMFGSVRKPAGFERTRPRNQSDRMTPQQEDKPPTPISKDGPPIEQMLKAKAQPVARVVGAGVLEVGQLMHQDGDEERFLSIWSPAAPGEEEEDVHDMDEAIPRFLYSETGRYVRSSRASRMHLQLAPFSAADAGALVQTNPTTMHMINQAQKLGFSEAPTVPRSDIYITFLNTSIPKDARLSHPEAGFVPLTSERLMNLQLTMEVRDGFGKRIDHCIFPSSNSTGVTAWRTSATELGSPWAQTICLKIPSDLVAKSHLIMSVADAPDFPFGLAWMPLWDKQAFIHDGSHRLILHAYDKSTSSMVNGKGAYLSLPWNTDDQGFTAGHDGVMASVATLNLDSRLCSTEYSQDQVVIGLINWKQQPSSKLMELLKALVFVPEIEIVKQLNDILNALFAVLVHKSGETKYEDQIFIDLVTVLGYVHDRRFNLGPIVDQYAESHFESPFAATCMIRSFTRLLQSVADADSARTLRALFKVGRHVIKLIITSHQQQKFNSASTSILKTNASFKEDMQSIFFGLQMMMRSETAALIGTKTLLVQHFHTWLPELLFAFNRDEVIRIAINFVEACKDVQGKLVLYKIIMILNYAKLDELWSEQEDRQILITNCLRWLAPYWGERHGSVDQWSDQVRLCCSVVSQLVKRPVPMLYQFMPKIVDSYRTIAATPTSSKSTLSLLFPKAYPFVAKPTNRDDNFNEALLELAALMSTISTAAPPDARVMSFQDQDLMTYIVSVMEVQRSLLESEAFPESWLSLNIYHHRSAMKILEYVSRILMQSFLPDPEHAESFSMELWRAFFMTLLKLVGSETLALETFPEQKRRVVWKVAGDVRESGADLLRNSWEAIGWESGSDDLRRYDLKRLGGYQVQYVPSLVGPILELCLSVHEGLRRVAVEILQTMIISEWALSEDLVLIETEMIASLDVIFKNKPVTESIAQKLFIAELLDLFEPIASQPDDALWVAIKDLVTTIDELMDLLVAAHGDATDTSLHTLRLMDFMKDMQKEDIFIRYVHELAKEQALARNSTEAGLALQLHADLYAWDTSKSVPALGNPSFPEQTAFDRKEALYFQIIQHFEDGKAWAPALALYKELADQYEYTIYDFAKLARTQRAMGKINETISKSDGQNFRYFRVLFRGMGFPASMRDKQYIYEGPSTERMAAFTDRLQKQHPSAQVLSPGDPVITLEGQYIEVSSVSPYRDLNHPAHMRSRLAPSVREHLLVARPRQFTTTSRRVTDGGNKLTDVRAEKLVYSTSGFPSILRKCEILSQDTILLSPIEVAIERTWRKTAELQGLELRAASGDDSSNIGLTAALILLLDTESPGSTSPALYREFLPQKTRKPAKRLSDMDGDEQGDDEEDHTPQLKGPRETALYVALSDHASVIKRCLLLYTRPALQATRKDLNARFDAVYPEEIRLATPSSRGNEERRGSRGSLSFDDVPLDARENNEDLASETVPTNNRVTSPEPQSGRRARQDKSNRLSMSFLKGGAASLMPEWSDSKRSKQHAQAVSTAKSQSNGHDSFKESNGINGGPLPALHAAQHNRHSMVSEPHTPAPLDNDEFGRNLTDSLGASISMGRFTSGTTSESNGQDRPATRDSETTTSTGKPKKRFSLMRLGSKKSGASVREQ